MTTEEWDEIYPINISKTEEQLKEQIWQRYGSFELSHEKNVGIVENILEFILKERKAYAELHVKAALKAVYEQNEEILDKTFIINAYPLTNIK